MPTTKEFGPRGAYGDWEQHEKVATRFGVSTTRSPEQPFVNSGGGPDNTTLRLADSVNVFEAGALAPGVTVDRVDYRVLAFDAGVKYRGFFLQAEYYNRWLDNFKADGPLPVRSIHDSGFYVQAASTRCRRSSSCTPPPRRSSATSRPASQTAPSTWWERTSILSTAATTG